MNTLVIIWLIFFILHSLLAATSVKNTFAKLLGNGFRFYRLAYSIIAILLLFLIVIQLWRLDSELIFDNALFFKVTGWTLILAGFYVVSAAFKNMDLFAFIGLSTRDESPSGLITEGWYKVVRHPLYWGTFLFLNGIFFLKPTMPVLLSVILSVIYIVIGIEFEEKKLRQLYGRAYDEYAFGKKKFIPFVW